MSGAGPISLRERPRGLPYAEADDFDARALLEDRGEGTGREGLERLLREGEPIVQAAAARTLGADGHADAVDPLRRLATDDGADEVARVQAAFALARLGHDDGREALAAWAEASADATHAPIVAAGALARLGDARGLPVVLDALRADGPWATVAARQLHAFLPLDDAAYRAAGLALAHPSESVRTEARAQLTDAQAARARAAAR